MSTEDLLNPYEAPRSSTAVDEASDDALIKLRQEHLPVEAGIYAFGVLDIMGSLMTGLVSLGSAMVLRRHAIAETWQIIGANTLLALLLAYTGASLLRLRSHGRFLQAIVFALLAYGTVSVHAFGGALVTALWAIVSAVTFLTAKARTVFEPRYRQVVIPASAQLRVATAVLPRVALLSMAVLVPLVMLYQLFQPDAR